MKGLVLLHGRGGSAQNTRGLVPQLGGEALEVVAPEAEGRSWWPTSFLAPSAEMEPWVARGMERVDRALEDLALPRDQVAVLGFSQGACLALEYVARRGAGLGAVIALSGGVVGTADAGPADPALFGAMGKDFGYGTDLTGLRGLVTCHEQDPHIPLKRARQSVDILRGLGAEMEMIAHPGPGHQPMADGIAAARAILST